MRTLALRRIFFLGVMGWGDGDIQVSRRRRRRRSSEAPRSSPRLPEAPQKRQKLRPSRPICSQKRQNQAFMYVSSTEIAIWNPKSYQTILIFDENA